MMRILYYRGLKWTVSRQPRRLQSREYVHIASFTAPDGTVIYPGMTGAHVRRIARDIADDIIADARNSGDDPVVWVTGNSYMPAFRSFSAAEDVWQHPANDDGEAFGYLVEVTERYLSDANVALESPEYDNALYAVDLARFEYREDETGDTLQDEWIARSDHD